MIFNGKNWKLFFQQPNKDIKQNSFNFKEFIHRIKHEVITKDRKIK